MEVYIGTVMIFAFNYAPQDGCNWIPCQGQILNINQYQALAAILGVKYGGDGRTTFGIPDLRNAAPVPNAAYYIATSGLFPSRQ